MADEMTYKPGGPKPRHRNFSQLMNAHDQAEIEKFKTYLRELAAWENKNDTLPDFAPISEAERVAYELKKVQAQVEIYKRIYG